MMEAKEKHRKIDEWKSNLEHLRMQLHLGLEEAKDEFENQKEHLKTWINDTQEKLADAKDYGKEKALKVKAGMEELRVQAALGRAETEETLKEQREKMSHKIHDLKHNLKEAYNSSEDTVKEILGDANDKLEDFHTRFDLFRLHAHLARMEADEAWEDRKKDLSHKIHELNQQLEKGKNVTAQKWDHFSSEMSEAWSHFKKAIIP